MKPPNSAASGSTTRSERGNSKSRPNDATARPIPRMTSMVRRSKRSERLPTGTWNARPPSTAVGMKTPIVPPDMAWSCIHIGISA